MTTEQAQIVVHLPATAPEVAEKTGFAADAIQKELDTLVVKGIVYPRRDPGSFRLAFDTLMLHDTTLTARGIDMVKDRKLFELWDDFSMNEEYVNLGKKYAAFPEPPWRVVPAYKALEGLPNVSPLDDFRELLKLKAEETISVIPCPCRLRKAGIKEPCDHSDEDKDWVCFQFGRGASYAVARGAARQLTAEEAVSLVDEVEDAGFIHTWTNGANSDKTLHSCQCCQDCCVLYQALDMVGESVGKIWAKSPYEAVVDEIECDGCQDCVERCHFDAIEMFKPNNYGKGRRNSKKLKARVDPVKCWGCGLCVPTCAEAKAMGFKQVRPAGHVPAPAS
jgi:ferredoxin